MSERDAARQARLQEDLLDTLDEELEMEIDDHLLGGESISEESRETRRMYFRELFRLQGELVKLQDWVIETGHRLVVIFEGRDAAGKGGAIKSSSAPCPSSKRCSCAPASRSSSTGSR